MLSHFLYNIAIMNEIERIDRIFSILNLKVSKLHLGDVVYVLDENSAYTHFESSLMPVFVEFGTSNPSIFQIKHKVLKELSRNETTILVGCLDMGETYRRKVVIPKAKTIEELYMKICLTRGK